MEQAYAQAVLQAIERGMAPKEALTRLRDVLKRSHREKLMPKIASALKKSARAAQRRSGAELTIAREGDRESALAEVSELSGKATPAVHVDETLIGGWILTAGSTRTDASYKKQLLTLYRNITK